MIDIYGAIINVDDIIKCGHNCKLLTCHNWFSPNKLIFSSSKFDSIDNLLWAQPCMLLSISYTFCNWSKQKVTKAQKCVISVEGAIVNLHMYPLFFLNF